MSAKLKVDELRAQLSLRGLDTSGSKPTLVRRLDAALRKEKKEADAPDKAAGDIDSSNDDSSKGGRKRRRNDAPDDASKDIEDEGKSKKEKLVTMTKKNGAVLDPFLPCHIKSNFHVLQKAEEIYSATLNQTNVGDNNNKFYVIQALESDDGRSFMVYNRWGRVGVRGQDKLLGPYTSQEDAFHEFDNKFYAKTKNWWHQRKQFKLHPKSYTWLEMDYADSENETVVSCLPVVHNRNIDGSTSNQIQPTKLDSRIAKFVSLICNVSMMKQQMLEIGYNAEKLPLGKLSKSTILKGYDVLRRISEALAQFNKEKCEELSGEFYTVIPHDFGFKKMREFVIDTPGKLKAKLEMVESLAEIEIATKILQNDVEAEDDPLNSRYKQLQCELSPIEVDTKEFAMIKKYLLNTHAKTHSGYTVDIVQIFKVSRKDELEGFKKFSNTKNRMLLWHGSRLTNWTGILSQGLRIAPPEAPVTGYMFGKGVYFADMFSKSANYCYSSTQSREGVSLLCEVALGDMAELLSANYNADQLPEGKLSTKGVGFTAPKMSDSQILEDGVIVPLGTPEKQNVFQSSLLYNEYIVYNVEQIRMRYVIQVQFNFKH
ncbi:poly [ADP-ribose] polymerase 2-A-like isoform X1 [Zingiber officinale]|uniref:poly [ADP-ribose] polymerase 2-A-like isoform X1 n=1 Tax=Zingiber officinale TaxID=94328 RepID=UPI001C4D5BDC|nr:poly [ADP-ribose] polymerase 2-A-like isoform X1 [Zingiber officinale]